MLHTPRDGDSTTSRQFPKHCSSFPTLHFLLEVEYLYSRQATENMLSSGEGRLWVHLNSLGEPVVQEEAW